MAQNESLITVVISLKNGADALRRTLASMSGQLSVNRVSILIVDANSFDFPIDVVDFFSSSLDIVFLSGFDSGIYSAWNKALTLVNTPWVTFFGAGDTFCDGALNTIISYVLTNPEVDVITSRSRNILRSGDAIIGGKLFSFEEFSRYFTTNHSGLLYRRCLFDRYGNFDENYRSSADYEFLIRVGRRARFDYIDVIVSNYIVGGISSRSTMPLFESFDVRRRHKTVGWLENHVLLARALGAFYLSKLRHL